MSRFNNFKTDFREGLGINSRAIPNSVAQNHRARVLLTYKSDDPNQSHITYIKASLINIRKELQLSIEPEVIGSLSSLSDFVGPLFTEITVIPENDSATIPSQGDEILVSLITSEDTKILNIDGYYKRVLKRSEGPELSFFPSITGSLQGVWEGVKNSLFATDEPASDSTLEERVKRASKVDKDLNTLNPKAKPKFDKLIQLMKQEDLPIVVFEVYRSEERQRYLYSKGRTTEEIVKVGITEFPGIPTLKKATKVVSPKDSKHFNNLAIDCVLDIKHPYWAKTFGQDYVRNVLSKKGAWHIDSNTRPIWNRYGELAKSVGLVWGGYWTKFPDFPHVEHPWIKE